MWFDWMGNRADNAFRELNSEVNKAREKNKNNSIEWISNEEYAEFLKWNKKRIQNKEQKEESKDIQLNEILANLDDTDIINGQEKESKDPIWDAIKAAEQEWDPFKKMAILIKAWIAKVDKNIDKNGNVFYRVEYRNGNKDNISKPR